jgi:hypothetical protein
MISGEEPRKTAKKDELNLDELAASRGSSGCTHRQVDE